MGYPLSLYGIAVFAYSVRLLIAHMPIDQFIESPAKQINLQKIDNIPFPFVSYLFSISLFYFH